MTLVVDQPRPGVTGEVKGTPSDPKELLMDGGFVVPDANSFGHTFRSLGSIGSCTRRLNNLGKVLLHPSFGQLPQWAVVADTFPVGCAFDECNVHHKYFAENPDHLNTKYNKLRVYSEGCGFNNVLISWGHDDYMYLVAKENKTSLPLYLMSEEDKENLKWLHVFNKYDLYSKRKVRLDVEKVKPYYVSLIEKYFPAMLKW